MARFVLVHGAFGGTWAWGRVAPLLRDAGHRAEVVELPGAGSDPTPIAEVTLPAYAQRICSILKDGPPALLVGQSMGGMAITQAAARCPQNVVALAYVAAFAPQEGESLLDLAESPEGAGDMVQSNLVVEGDPPVARLPVEVGAGGSVPLRDTRAGRLGRPAVGPAARGAVHAAPAGGRPA